MNLNNLCEYIIINKSSLKERYKRLKHYCFFKNSKKTNRGFAYRLT